MVRSAAHADDVPRDLHGRENESPRKSPPAEDEREGRAAELSFDGAGMATDLRLGRPSSEDKSGPNLINFVDINRSKPTTLGTIAAPDFFNFAVEHVGRDVFGDAQDISVLAAFVIAEALVAHAHAAHDDR